MRLSSMMSVTFSPEGRKKKCYCNKKERVMVLCSEENAFSKLVRRRVNGKKGI